MWGEAPLDVSVVTTWLSPAKGLVFAPREDRLVAHRALGFGRSIHGGQGATRLLVPGCADLAGSVPLGQTSNHAAAKDLMTVQQAFLRAAPGRAQPRRLPRPDRSRQGPCGERSSRPGIRRHPMTHLQRASPLHGIAYTL